MRRQHFGDQSLKFFHHRVRNSRAFFLGERLLQRSTLVHGSGGDYTAFIRYGFHSGQFAGGELHTSSWGCSSKDNSKPNIVMKISIPSNVVILSEAKDLCILCAAPEMRSPWLRSE